MSVAHLTDEQWDELINRASGTIGDYAAAWGVNPNTLRRHVGERKRQSPSEAPQYTEGTEPDNVLVFPDLPPQNGAQRGGMPEPATLLQRAPLRLNLDRWLYASDLHAPLHSKRMLQRLCDVAHHQQVDVLILGGDSFDFDSISRHGRAERQAGLNDTLRIGGAILDSLCDVFERIYILPGNHCRRVAAKLDDALDFEMLVRASVKRARVSSDASTRAEIITTDYDYIYVGADETGWVVGHPRFYTKSAKAYASVASIQHRNVIGAHTHQQGIAWSDCGRYRMIDPGAMCEASITPYYQTTQGLSRYPVWKQGFVLVENNIPSLLADGWCDWGAYDTM